MIRKPYAALVVIVMAMLWTEAAHSQAVPKHYLSAASTNSTAVFAPTNGAILRGGVAVNTTATIYYLKFYNKVTAPTCNSDPVVWTIPLPATSSVPLPVGEGVAFSAGLGFCITGGIADNDNTNAATGVAVDLAVSGR